MDIRQQNALKVTASMLPFASSAGVLYLAFNAFHYLFFPKISDAASIYDFCVLIGFEFILVGANIFLSMFASRSLVLFWCLALLFFLPFFYCFSLFMIDVSVMKGMIACLIISHLVDMFTVTLDEGAQLTGYYALRIMLYFFVLMFCVLLSGVLPAFKLSPAFLTASSYNVIKRHGGLLLDQPNIAVTIGLLYYGSLSLAKVGRSVNRMLGLQLGPRLLAFIEKKTNKEREKH